MWHIKTIDTKKALYLAIADALERDIKAGLLKPGDRLPTHRELAKTVGVNVTTVTRAYAEAQKRGLLKASIGSGTYVSVPSGSFGFLSDEREKKTIEMALVLPLYEAEAEVARLFKHALPHIGQVAFASYCSPPGPFYGRKVGADWINRFGLDTNPEQIVITCGAQHALNCVFASLFKQGDRIACDALIYPGLKPVAKSYRLTLEGLSMDEEGMKPKSLIALCRQHEVRGIYLSSSLQNPTNAQMSQARQEELAKIIVDHDLTLIEDDIYRFLMPEPARPLSAMLPERSVYITGISKALHVGFRITFLSAPKNMAQAISQAVLNSVLMVPPLDLALVCQAIEEKLIDEIIETKIACIQKRFALFEKALSPYEFRYTPHSPFVWLKLPERFTSSAFERLVLEHGVHVSSSERFFIGGQVPPNYVRLSLTGPDSEEELQAGLSILARVLEKELIPSEYRQPLVF